MIQLAEKRMKEILQEQGISILGIRVIPRNESKICVRKNGRLVDIPCLYLLTGEAEYNLFQQEAYKNIAVSAWQKAVRESGLASDEYYDSDMHIGASNMHRKYLEEFARGRKRQIREYLYKTLHGEPWRIYASSTPGVYIVYETEDYKKLEIESCGEKLAEDIRKMAGEYVKQQYGAEIPCWLSVEFLHPEMEGYNGYGLSRED